MPPERAAAQGPAAAAAPRCAGRALLPLAAAVCSVLALLLRSARAQSLVVFANWLNWPPFHWSSPESPSPAWARAAAWLFRRWAVQTGAFEGLVGAVSFEVQGSQGMLRGWRIPCTVPASRTVLYLHGNAGNIATRHRVWLYKLLTSAALGCDVVTVDYAGFGHSEGRWPDEASAVADALAALRALPGRRCDVVVWGHSLGSGIALGALSAMVAAGEPLPRGLILESALLSVPDVAADSWGWWLPRAALASARAFLHRRLSAHRMPSIERVARVARAMHVAVLHGSGDAVVPCEHGRRLAEEASVRFESFERGHDDIVEDPQLTPVLTATFKDWEFEKIIA